MLGLTTNFIWCQGSNKTQAMSIQKERMGYYLIIFEVCKSMLPSGKLENT